jgi:hypothetical protein
MENVPCIIGLCGRIGSGKSTVESYISHTPKYVQSKVNNRIDYIMDVMGNVVEKKKLIEIINMYVQKGLGDELNVEGKYKVWKRDYGNFSKDMYNSFSYAEPLKIIGSIIYNYDFNILLGLTEENRKLRETLKAKNGKSGRECLEYLGTDVFRKHIGKNIWIDILTKRVLHYMNNGYSICIPDVRFKNEYKVLKKIAHTQIWVIFKNANELELSKKDTDEHKSRWSFLTFIDRKEDVFIDNADSKENLKHKVYDFLDWAL